MILDFQQQGRAMLGNGYFIIPIRRGEKRPVLENWQTARLGSGDLGRYQNHGIGVLCGQGAHPIAAIDIDTTDSELATLFVDWCMNNLGLTCERIGNAPKTLLAYLAASEGWGKATGAWFEDQAGKRHRLELLGKGQQFVAYNIHPDTGRPYEWVDILGGLEAMPARCLPVITEEQVQEALSVFETMAVKAGMVKVKGSQNRADGVASVLEDDPLMAYEPPVGISLSEARQLLNHVDNKDYDAWLKVGMSLHHEFSGNSEALALWDEWSRTASNYASFEDLSKRWEGFGCSGKNPTTARWLLKIGHQGKNEAARAEKRSALEEAREQIQQCTDSIDLLNIIAKKAGEAAGTDLAVRAELVGLIRARFKELTSTVLTVTEVRSAMDGGSKGSAFGNQNRQMTEFGNAERMLDQYGEGLMYVPEIDAWFTWTGVYWRRAAGVELEHLAKETVRALPDEIKKIESDVERVGFFKFCSVSQRSVMVQNMVALAKSDPKVVVGVSELDRSPYLFGVGNGAVDLRTGKLLSPNQAHRITTITEVEYDPDAKAPLFEQTVFDVFSGDEEMIGFFQRLIGYTLMGQPTEDIIVIPYGSGSNGKSTVLGAIREVLGKHAKMVNAETFLSNGKSSNNPGAPREDILRLRGARFVHVSEPEEGSELREGLIKSMTGGEAMPARGVGASTTIEVMPTWVVFMPTNHRPIVKGEDHAIWRRLMPVPFTRNFDQDPTVKKDTDRAVKLAAEAQGILAWCVRGALKYKKNRLMLPDKVSKARDDYKSDMDLLGEWMSECCEVEPNYVETSARLWASWEVFAKTRGELRFIASAKSLGRRLQAKGFEPVRSAGGIRGRGMRGICVRQVGDFI